jgi:hypothetical protein
VFFNLINPINLINLPTAFISSPDQLLQPVIMVANADYKVTVFV